MKFVFIATRSIEKIGGIETYMSKLAPKLGAKGHEVVLYSMGETNETKIWNNITIQQIKGQDGKYAGKIKLGLKATLHALRHHKNANIFHYHAMGVGLSSILPILMGKTVVFQGHGFEWQRAKWNKINQLIIKFLDYFVLSINSNILMVSQNQSDYVSKKFNKPVVTITPGIDLPEIKDFTDNILIKYNLKEGEYILYLGRLVQEKKADVLINAYLKSNIKNKKLVIAGDNPYEKKYIDSLKKLASENKNIIFTGSVFGEDKENLIAKCFLFCIPSELEGLPITLLEAMSYKKACIASDIPACKEALGNNGIYFQVNNVDNLANVLVTSINNTNLREIGYKNYNRVADKFTWENIAYQYEKYCYLILNRIQK